jgi:4'-phosphopantetheinyl transferase EntD
VSALLERILPADVVAEELFADPADTTLFPEEEAVVARAVAKRRTEFATVRRCARAALSRLGVPEQPILPGAGGAPQWPPGIVGSMTHCTGYRAAVVARRPDVATVGVDAEPHDVLPDGILENIASAGERAMLARMASNAPAACWDRLLFSAKEAVYKAWFPLTGRWLDFADAEVSIDPAASSFTARLLTSGPVLDGHELRAFTGRFRVQDGLIVTAIAVPAG